jgi:hypothetical protein
MSHLTMAGAGSVGSRADEIGLIGGKIYRREGQGVTGVQAYRMETNGDLTETGSVGLAQSLAPGAGEWHVRNTIVGLGDDWEVRATVVSGSLTSGSTGIWERLNSARVWTREGTTATIETVTLDFDFRLFGTTTILKTVPNVVLQANSVPL